MFRLSRTHGVLSVVLTSPLLRGALRKRGVTAFTVPGIIVYRDETTSTRKTTRNHEYAHILQMKKEPLRMFLSYLRYPHWKNPYEEQARSASLCDSREAVELLVGGDAE